MRNVIERSIRLIACVITLFLASFAGAQVPQPALSAPIPAATLPQACGIAGGQVVYCASNVTVSDVGTLDFAGTPVAISNANFAFEGDSRFQGGPAIVGLTCPNGTGYNNGALGLSCSIPGQASALSFFNNHGTVYNEAVGGTTIAQMNTNYTTNVHPLSPAVTGKPGYLFIQTSYNDITAGTAIATMESGIQAAWTQGHTDGWTVVMTTMIPGTGGAAQLLVIGQFLDFVRTQACGSMASGSTACWDRLVDLTGAAPDPFDSAYYFTDNVHMFSGGWALMAHTLNQQMSTQESSVGTISLGPLGTGNANYRGNQDALVALTTGGSDSATGDSALVALTTGTSDTCFGATSCTSLTTQSADTVFGAQAYQTGTGAFAAVFGQDAAPASSGNNITALGWQAGNSLTSGANNTFVGTSAGNTTTSGTFNTAVGAGATTGTTTNGAIAIGQGSSASTTQAIAIGFFATASASGAVQIGPSGGTNSVANSLQFNALPVAGGATFTVTGCGTATSLIGNGLVGTFAAASTTCAPVITTGLTAPHGYVCDMGDRTTSADFTTHYNTATSATTATWPSQTVVSGDVMAFKCSAY
jgi:hypothetical protein